LKKGVDYFKACDILLYMNETNKPKTTMLGLTIVALGFASAFGTQKYLSGYLGGFPSILAAGAIECAYICLAAAAADIVELDALIVSTAKLLIAASFLFNFGHAYSVALPGGLVSGTARFDWLAAIQAGVVAGFIPAIAFKLSRVKATIERHAVVVAPVAPVAVEADKVAAQIASLEAAVSGIVVVAKKKPGRKPAVKAVKPVKTAKPATVRKPRKVAAVA
jgi:hypothetical protein